MAHDIKLVLQRYTPLITYLHNEYRNRDKSVNIGQVVLSDETKSSPAWYYRKIMFGSESSFWSCEYIRYILQTKYGIDAIVCIGGCLNGVFIRSSDLVTHYEFSFKTEEEYENFKVIAAMYG